MAPQTALSSELEESYTKTLMGEIDAGRTIVLAESPSKEELVKSIESGEMAEKLGDPFVVIITNSVFVHEEKDKDRMIDNLSVNAPGIDIDGSLSEPFAVNYGTDAADAKLKFGTLQDACENQ